MTNEHDGRIRPCPRSAGRRHEVEHESVVPAPDRGGRDRAPGGAPPRPASVFYLRMMVVCAPVAFSAAYRLARSNAPTLPGPRVTVPVNGLFLTLHWPVGLVVSISIHLHLLAERRRASAVPTDRRRRRDPALPTGPGADADGEVLAEVRDARRP